MTHNVIEKNFRTDKDITCTLFNNKTGIKKNHIQNILKMYEINIYDLDVYKWTVLIGTMEEIEIERCIDKIKDK